jgi:hypothetical protein
MRLKLSAALALGLCAAVAFPAIAGARGLENTKVTIKEDAPGDFFGFVKSSTAPALCGDERKVTLYKKVGAQQDPSEDTKINSDNAGLQGDKYRWDTGNTNTRGKVYARAKKTDDCMADNSQTIQSSA